MLISPPKTNPKQTTSEFCFRLAEQVCLAATHTLPISGEIDSGSKTRKISHSWDWPISKLSTLVN